MYKTLLLLKSSTPKPKLKDLILLIIFTWNNFSSLRFVQEKKQNNYPMRLIDNNLQKNIFHHNRQHNCIFFQSYHEKTTVTVSSLIQLLLALCLRWVAEDSDCWSTRDVFSNFILLRYHKGNISLIQQQR